MRVDLMLMMMIDELMPIPTPHRKENKQRKRSTSTKSE
jgi:hypothetical protein